MKVYSVGNLKHKLEILGNCCKQELLGTVSEEKMRDIRNHIKNKIKELIND